MTINRGDNSGRNMNINHPADNMSSETLTNKKKETGNTNPKSYSPTKTYIPNKRTSETERKTTDITSRIISSATNQTTPTSSSLDQDILKLKSTHILMKNLPELIASAKYKEDISKNCPVKVHFVKKVWDDVNKKYSSVKIQLLPKDPTIAELPKAEQSRINKLLINALEKYKKQNNEIISSLESQIKEHEDKIKELLYELEQKKIANRQITEQYSTIKIPLSSETHGSEDTWAEYFESVVDLKESDKPAALRNSESQMAKKADPDHTLSFNSSLSHATDIVINQIADYNIKRLGGFAPNCQYLLNKQRQGWHVAYAPPVTSNAGLPIHTYLSEDKDIQPFITSPYQGHFALNEVKSVLKEKGDKAKIIFPLLTVQNNDVHALTNHYVTIEVQIEINENGKYNTEISAHNPNGSYGGLSFDDYNKLVDAIGNTFNEEFVEFSRVPSPYVDIPRQGNDDPASCGYICIDECFKRLKNEPLNMDRRYESQAKKLRLEHRVCLQQNTNDVVEIDDDPEYSAPDNSPRPETPPIKIKSSKFLSVPGIETTFLPKISSPDQSEIFNSKNSNYKALGSVNAGNEDLSLGGSRINDQFRKEINPTNDLDIDDAFQKMHHYMLQRTPKGNINFEDVSKKYPETNINFVTALHRNVSKIPNNHDGTIFIETWNTKNRSKIPHNNTHNRAMIYIVPPNTDNYSSVAEYRNAIGDTAMGIVASINTHNLKMHKLGRHDDIISTIRIPDFTTTDGSDSTPFVPQWASQIIQKGLAAGLMVIYGSEARNTIKEIQLPYTLHKEE